MKSFMNVVVSCSLSVLGLAGAANADVLANWTFETSFPGLALTNSAASPSATAEAGIYQAGSVANGVHLSVNTDWSSPAGNGSLHSFSSNEYAIGDYYQFQSSSTGYQGISISWNQTRSSTGPGTWDLYWSTDNATYNLLLDNYIVPAIGWSTTTPDVTNTTVFLAVAAPAVMDNQASIYFRLVVDAAPGGTGGTSRVDNVVIEGTLIPAPGALALLGLAGLVGRGRRRR